jgi:hypothetical protein
MKNSILSILTIGGMFFFNQITLGQVTATSNAFNANNYVGFNTSNNANPLFFRTNALNRMKINGNLNYAVNGYNAARNGNVLIGVQNNTMNSNLNMYTGNMGVYSLLHLNGAGSLAQEYGYRPWMDAGVTLTGNRDFAYYGLRKVGTSEDHSEAVFLWADNGAGGDQDGPDNMVFSL